MQIAYEVTATGDIFSDKEMAEKYAENLRERGHKTEVLEVVV